MPESKRNRALITGASAGIGATFAFKLAERGYDLTLVARRREKLESMLRRIAEKHDVNCEIVPADLANHDDVRMVADRIRNMPDLTMLVNNAGFGTIGSFADVALEKHLDMIGVHVLATVELCHAALPAMIEKRRGDIINVSSVSGFMDNPGGVTYNATKAYLNSFSKTLHHEVEEYGLRVQALCPGFTRTEFHEVGDFTDFDRNRVPSSWWLAPEYVVEKSLKALEKGTVICIPHLRYKSIVALYRNRPIARLMRPIIRRKRWQKSKTAAAAKY